MPTPATVRIIAGRWRGRRLAFPEVPGLRPSPDRVRETLFSWLQGHLPGSRCLDLFAGSGVLGFEALSRGAAEVTLVEANAAVVSALQASAAQLDAAPITHIYHQDAGAFLQGQEGMPYDIVFCDPPFGQGLVARMLPQLAKVSAQWMYVESEAEILPPDGWLCHRSGHAGQVYYHLFKRI